MPRKKQNSTSPPQHHVSKYFMRYTQELGMLQAGNTGERISPAHRRQQRRRQFLQHAPAYLPINP